MNSSATHTVKEEGPILLDEFLYQVFGNMLMFVPL